MPHFMQGGLMNKESRDTREIRVLLLQLAQRTLEQQVQVEMAKSQGKSGSAPNTEDIISEAEKLFEFVQRAANKNQEEK